MRPVDIAHITAEGTLAVTWEDETVSVFPLAYLRAWCPCAECQGHGNVIAYRPVAGLPDAPVSLWEVGAYALGIRFADGHDKGIFRWDWLLKIAPERPPHGLKRGRFVAGVYEMP